MNAATENDKNIFSESLKMDALEQGSTVLETLF